MAGHIVPRGLNLLAVVALPLLAVGCGLPGIGGSSDVGKDVVAFRDIDEVTLAEDPAAIKETRLRGNLLRVKVTFGGGCREHRFQMFGSVAFDMSLPPQAHLLLSHDAQADPCDAVVVEELAFDLRLLKAAWRDAHRYRGPVRIRIRGPGDVEPVAILTTDL